MLPIPQLDFDYEKLVDRAVGLIPTLTSEWTDFNHHDPGITMLQTFAWLSDMLGFYMNATGPVHKLRYLSLLGLEPLARQAAQCVVALDAPHNIHIPQGTRMLAGDTVFETTHSYDGATAQLCVLADEVDGAPCPDMAPLLQTGRVATAFATPDVTSLLVGFSRPLSGTVRLFVSVDDNGRNPCPDGFSLVSLDWSYWDGDDWQPITAGIDDTCGLLRSGSITLTLGSETRETSVGGLPQAHMLRCTLAEHAYDLPPGIRSITVNCVEVEQADSLSRALVYTYDGSGTLVIDHAVGGTDVVTVAIADDDGFDVWLHGTPADTDLCRIEWDGARHRHVVRFDENKYRRVPEKGSEVLVVIARAPFVESAVIGMTTPFASQRLLCDIGDGAHELRIALRDDAGDRPHVTLWDMVDDITAAPCDAQAFSYDFETRELVFGDSLHGRQPPAGYAVWLVEARRSLFERGNVLAGEIDRLETPTTAVALRNPVDAAGGRRTQTPDELERRIASHLSATRRAVSAHDYETIVGATPGLLVGAVNVIPARVYNDVYDLDVEPRTVYVAVKPALPGRRPQLPARYREIIRRHIEQYRLLTTNVVVLPVQYIGVRVHGRIALRRMAQAREQVTALLRELIDGGAGFGRDVSYGHLYSQLEMCPAVQRIGALSLEFEGAGARRNDRGDILLYPDSIAYLDDIRIDFE